jgi:hypothetical protein
MYYTVMNNNQLLRTVIRGTHLVSTVKLPVGRTFYETMVFTCDEHGKVTDWLELDCKRSSSPAAAAEAHLEIVSDWTEYLR